MSQTSSNFEHTLHQTNASFIRTAAATAAAHRDIHRESSCVYTVQCVRQIRCRVCTLTAEWPPSPPPSCT